MMDLIYSCSEQLTILSGGLLMLIMLGFYVCLMIESLKSNSGEKLGFDRTTGGRRFSDSTGRR